MQVANQLDLLRPQCIQSGQHARMCARKKLFGNDPRSWILAEAKRVKEIVHPRSKRHPRSHLWPGRTASFLPGRLSVHQSKELGSKRLPLTTVLHEVSEIVYRIYHLWILLKDVRKRL